MDKRMERDGYKKREVKRKGKGTKRRKQIAFNSTLLRYENTNTVTRAFNIVKH